MQSNSNWLRLVWICLILSKISKLIGWDCFLFKQINLIDQKVTNQTNLNTWHLQLVDTSESYIQTGSFFFSGKKYPLKKN